MQGAFSSHREFKVKASTYEGASLKSFLIEVDYDFGEKECSFCILLNCGNDSSSDRLRLPEGLRTLERKVDCVLLTGASLNEIGSLPHFLSTSSDPVKVLCTEPVYKFGKLGLYDYIENKADGRCRLGEGERDGSADSMDSEKAYQLVDEQLSSTVRLRYQQIYFLTKNFNGSFVNLIIRAYPSGLSLGGTVWFLEVPGHLSSLLLSINHSPKPNWFFGGFDVTQLPKDPSVVFASCPFQNPPLRESVASDRGRESPQSISEICSDDSLDGDLELTSPGKVGAGSSPNFEALRKVLGPPDLLRRPSAASRILQQSLMTLLTGGSVLIPMNISTDMLKVLTLFEAAWVVRSEKNPPPPGILVCVTGTGSVLLDFAKSMLEWMSPPIRKHFASTRENPFKAFRFIRFVTSASEALYMANQAKQPAVFIATPSSPTFGHSCTILRAMAKSSEGLLILTEKAGLLGEGLKTNGLCKTEVEVEGVPILRGEEIKELPYTREELHAIYVRGCGRVKAETSETRSSPEGSVSHRESPSHKPSDRPEKTTSSMENEEIDYDHIVEVCKRLNQNKQTDIQSGDYGNTFQPLFAVSANEEDEELGEGSLGEEGDERTAAWSKGYSLKRLRGTFGAATSNTDENSSEGIDSKGRSDGPSRPSPTLATREEIPDWQRKLRARHGGSDPTRRVVVLFEEKMLCRCLCVEDFRESEFEGKRLDAVLLAGWVVTTLAPLHCRELLIAGKGVGGDDETRGAFQRILTDCVGNADDRVTLQLLQPVKGEGREADLEGSAHLIWDELSLSTTQRLSATFNLPFPNGEYATTHLNQFIPIRPRPRITIGEQQSPQQPQRFITRTRFRLTRTAAGFPCLDLAEEGNQSRTEGAVPQPSRYVNHIPIFDILRSLDSSLIQIERPEGRCIIKVKDVLAIEIEEKGGREVIHMRSNLDSHALCLRSIIRKSMYLLPSS